MMLPEGYQEYKAFDFQRDTKKAVLFQVGSIVPFLVMAVVSLFSGLLSRIISAASSFHGLLNLLLKLSLILLGCVICICLHELLHAVLTRLLAGRFPKYQISWAGISSSLDVFWRKGQYLVTTLSGAIAASAVLIILAFLVPPEWFWAAYFTLALQLSLMAGDFILAWPVLRMPSGALVRDEGFRIVIYTKHGV